MHEFKVNETVYEWKKEKKQRMTEQMKKMEKESERWKDKEMKKKVEILRSRRNE